MFRRPLFLPLLAWVLGILIAQGAEFSLWVSAILVGMGGIGVFLISHRKVALLALLALSAGLGTLRTLSALQTPRYDLSRYAAPAGLTSDNASRGTTVTLIGRLSADPTEYPNRLSFPLQVEAAALDSKPIPANGRVWASLYPASASPGARTCADSHIFPAFTYGERVQVTGTLRLPATARNPGEFDYRAYLARNGIHSALAISGEEKIQRVADAGLTWTGLCLTAKRRMEAALRSTLPPQHAAIMSGLLFSEQRQLPPGLKDDFIATGTVHLLSTSGVHVAALALALQFLFGRSRRRFKKPFALLFIMLLVAFGVMAGMRPAVARAVLMAGCVYAADLVDRDADGPNLLCLAALVLLVLNPLDFYDTGFQFSFTAVAGLMLLASPFEDALRKWWSIAPGAGWKSTLVQLLSASLAVELALSPLLAFQTGQFSTVSIFANLVVIPPAALLIPSGLLQAFLGRVFPPLGGVTGFVLSGFLEVFTALIHAFASIPGALISVPALPILPILLYYGLALGWAKPWRLKRGWLRESAAPDANGITFTDFTGTFTHWKARFTARFPGAPASRRAALYASPVAVSALLFWGFHPSTGPLRFTMIDVGQGDCLLVQTPDGASMLVDGGGLRGYGEDPCVTFDVGEKIVVPYLRRIGLKKLDLVVLTHPHDDHVGGLGAVAEQMPVGMVVEGVENGESAAYRRFERAVERQRIPHRTVAAGDAFRLGREIVVKALAPSEPHFAGTNSDPNNNSIVLRLRYRKFTALLTGDIEHEAEERILSRVGPVSLLKVAHHGSRFSTDEEFVRRTRPNVALIGVGERNTFGHPNPQVIRRLQQIGTEVYRTDHDGAITVETDGQRVWTRSFLSRRRKAFVPLSSAGG